MKHQGFTLAELMIGMGIMAIIVILTFPAFTDLLFFSKGETASEEAQIDKIIGLELIRLDLENVGYGIARDEAALPISLTIAPLSSTNTSDTGTVLQLNSTLNNTNQSTIGWAIYDCSTGGSLESKVIVDMRQDQSNSNIVLLDHNKNYKSLTNTTSGNCPADRGIYTAFPYFNSATNDNSGTNNACAGVGSNTTRQFCTGVRYRLSATNTLRTCAAGTRNLLRAVGNAAGDPVMSCIADFIVTFALDGNGDGDLDDDSDNTQATALPATTRQIFGQVKNINMYILMQEGGRDNDLNNTNVDLRIPDSNMALSLRRVTDDPTNFRWKVVRISGKPMSM